MKVKYSRISYMRYNDNGTSSVGGVYPGQHTEFVYKINGETFTRPVGEGYSFEVNKGDIFECTVQVVGGNVEWTKSHFGPQKITKNTTISANLSPNGYRILSLMNLSPKNMVVLVNDEESLHTRGTTLKFKPDTQLNFTAQAAGYKTKTWTEVMPNANYAPLIELEKE